MLKGRILALTSNFPRAMIPCYLLADHRLVERLCVNGRKMAEEKFSEKASAQAFDVLLSQVLQCRN